MIRFARLAICTALLASAPLCSAFTLSPITLELEPSGRGASGTFRLENKSSEREAIQISIARREMKEDGTEVLTPVDDLFTFSPKKVLLEPRKFQVVRISWKGPANLPQEMAFRVIAEQLPVDNARPPGAEGGRVRLMLKYEGSLYVRPKSSKPALVLESIRRKESSNNELEVVIENKGNAHGLLTDFKLTVVAREDNTRVELLPDDLASMAGKNILARSKRKFIIPSPPGIHGDDIAGSLSVDSQP